MTRSLLMSLSIVQLCWDIFILFGRMRLDNLTERVSMIKSLSYMNVMSVKTDLTTIWSPFRTHIRVCIIISTTYHHFDVCWYVICILLSTAHHPMWSFNHNRMSLPSIIQHKYNINEEFIPPFWCVVAYNRRDNSYSWYLLLMIVSPMLYWAWASSIILVSIWISQTADSSSSHSIQYVVSRVAWSLEECLTSALLCVERQLL